MRPFDEVRYKPNSDFPCAMDTNKVFAIQAISASTGSKYLSGTFII
jgi:membrane-bound inhibitor of C-type lysozyme